MLDRRQLLIGAATAPLAASFAGAADAPPPPQTLRAALIGHTGKGDYGHGMDLLFKGRADVELVAVADPVEAGRAKAAARTGATRQYADYRQMLEKERPTLVSVGPRITPERREMLLAALSTGDGAHVFSEKPFVRCPADGDAVLELADRRGLRIAVAHQMRLAPAVVHLKKKVDDGLLGEIVRMTAWGKQDKRAGGEDLVVLGVHLFDLMRMFAGEPQWCAARILDKGKEATLASAKSATEDIGPVLGDDIEAQLAFDRGVLGTFTSRASLRDYSGWWGLELVGTKGAARILADIWPRVFVKRQDGWNDAGRAEAWKPLPDDPSAGAPAAQLSTALANTRLVDDWLAAIRDKREPTCSGRNAAKAVEMVHAVFQAGLSGGRVPFPLKARGHVLEAKG